jgi:hypothetical protein
VAPQQKRSISFPADLDRAVESAAEVEGTSVSAWLAAAAGHRLRIEAGWHALEAWEADNGRLSADELTAGRRRARALLDAAEREAV